MVKKKKIKKETDQALLDAIFQVEAEWKNLLQIKENSIETAYDSEGHLKLAEAKYMFLLKEAKHRKISLLRY